MAAVRPLHFSTVFARPQNSQHIERHVQRLAERFSRENLVCVFALSASEAMDWTPTWRHLRSIGSGPNGASLGCISGGLNGVGISSKQAERGLAGYLSCAVAVFRRQDVIPFRSTIPGDEQPQVGRWHAFRKQQLGQQDDPLPWNEIDNHGLGTGKVNWDDVWKQSVQDSAVRLPEFEGIAPESFTSFVYLSSPSHQGITRSLNRFFPSSSKLGLLASSTLTMNEQPCTMMYNDETFSEGAVGLGLHCGHAVDVSFQGTRSISPRYTVSSSQGNMITSLSDSNPTQLLLEALEAEYPTAERSAHPGHEAMYRLLNDKVYVGVYPRGNPHEVMRMHQVSAGDPSRGPLSLLAETAPVEGDQIQFFVCPQSNTHSLGPVGPLSMPEFRFVNVAESMLEAHPDPASPSLTSDYQERENLFVATSDAGVVAHGPSEGIESLGVGGPVGAVGSVTLL